MASWTKEEDEQITALYREGYSASDIANELPTVRSRNAVIGRLHRLKVVRSPESGKLAKARVNHRISSFKLHKGVNKEVLDLAKKFASATIYEITEAVAGDLGSISHIIIEKLGRRPLGGSKSYRAPLVAEMRASLQEVAA
jgi:hypothetical protein